MASDGDEFIDLAGANFTRGVLGDLEQRVVLREFSGYVTAVEGRINDGKEATVYLCRGRPDAVDAEFLAAKIYRARKFRAFATESRYRNPDKMRDRRLAKAIKGRSRTGQRASHHLWIDREWQALNALFDAGASVPKPYARCDDGVLMEFVGNAGVAAPALAESRLPPQDAERVFALLLGDIEILLDCGFVHGDLSAFNVLYLDGRPRLIDLPQAVNIDEVSDAWSLFYRDVENLCRYVTKCGVAADPLDIALRLWGRR
jgi:RIO kinase 1